MPHESYLMKSYTKNAKQDVCLITICKHVSAIKTMIELVNGCIISGKNKNSVEFAISRGMLTSLMLAFAIETFNPGCFQPPLKF